MFLVKVIFKTTLFLLLFSFLYLVVFLLPKVISDKELARAERILYAKYYALSQNRSMQTQYFSLDSISLNFSGEKNTLLTNIDESIKSLRSEVEKPYRKGFLFFPENNLKLNLEYFEKTDSELTKRTTALLDAEEMELDKIKKLNSALSNFYLYDMGVDFSGLDENSDADREVILERLKNANEGLIKVTKKLDELGGGQKTIKEEIEKLARNFPEMEKYINNGDTAVYRTLFNKTMDDYEKTRLNAFKKELDIVKSGSYLKVLADEKDIIISYEGLLIKINEMQAENWNIKSTN